MRASTFPDDFWWGAATSSHQVEGGNRNNDWWEWEMRAGTIHDGTRSGDAAGWWGGRAETDLEQAAEMGHTAHRMSVEWSRIEPRPGHFDDAALERYGEILDAARRLGLHTVVTLNHFTLPLWASARGSWLDPGLAERFGGLAARCVEALGPRVDLWATLNEPNVLGLMGYGAGQWPPGHRRVDRAVRAMVHQMRAHAVAYEAVHRVQPDARVGLVLNLPCIEPDRPGHLLDRAAAAAQDWMFSGVWLHALAQGRVPWPLSLTRSEVPGLRGSLDWLGVNYYGRMAVRFDPRAVGMGFGRHVQEPTVRSEFADWGQIHPEGLAGQLRRAARLGVPVYVTENGVFDPLDRVRPGYLLEHVAAVRDVLREGVDVRGYFHWSLVDNFEWGEGWATPFGLLSLDRGTQERQRRGSAEVYAELCRSGGAALDRLRAEHAR